MSAATLAFTSPATPGAYEYRLFANNGFVRLATSGPLTVVPSPARLTVNGVDPPAIVPAAAGARHSGRAST